MAEKTIQVGKHTRTLKQRDITYACQIPTEPDVMEAVTSRNFASDWEAIDAAVVRCCASPTDRRYWRWRCALEHRRTLFGDAQSKPRQQAL
jgi:hypothetical protein